MRHSILPAALLTVAACAPAPRVSTTTAPAAAAAVAPRPVEGTFVIMKGGDTVGTERFTRSSTSLKGAFAARGAEIFHYDATLAADASTSRIVVTVTPQGALPQTSVATFVGDSVLLTREPADSAHDARRAVARGAVAYLNPSPSLMEQIVRRARAIGGPSAAVPVFAGGGNNVTATVSFPKPDSARLDVGGVTLLLHVDQSGALLGGRVPMQGVTIERAPDR